jgi:hypothetical protein
MIKRERELKLAGFRRFASKDSQLMSLITCKECRIASEHVKEVEGTQEELAHDEQRACQLCAQSQPKPYGESLSLNW